MEKRVRFTIDGAIYHATLKENSLAEKITDMCPFTLDYRRSGEHEYYTALSLVFRDCNTTPYKIHPVGDFEKDVSAVLEKLGRNIRILCETE